MKVYELITVLGKMPAGAEVVVWDKDGVICRIDEVTKTKFGEVRISENGKEP